MEAIVSSDILVPISSQFIRRHISKYLNITAVRTSHLTLVRRNLPKLSIICYCYYYYYHHCYNHDILLFLYVAVRYSSNPLETKNQGGHLQFWFKNTSNTCSGVLPQSADTTVKVWSVMLPQLLSLAVRLGVAVEIASTALETNTRLKG
jgi:hypothetical protein